jgi:uncharacterized iron-regulated protein
MMPRTRLFTSMIFISSLMLGACQVKTVHDTAEPVADAEPAHDPHAHGQVEQQAPAVEEQGPAGLVLDLRNLPRLEDIIPELLKQRVVFVGEAHTTYGHHLSQLEIIRRLHEIDPNIAIGMEFFQQPFQQYLDAYSAGELDEKGMLTQTEYYDRWTYDYRLYQPILQYAREHKIPLIALNLPKEITRKVAEQGMAALTEAEKAQVPAEIDDSDAVYRQRMREIFEQHPHSNNQDFERFLQVQLLWDEGMAERAARYLEENPERRLVVLAGIGHVVNGHGIPDRLVRRIPVESAVVLPWGSLEIRPGIGDFVLFPEKTELPLKGYMGVMLVDDSEGVSIEELVPGGAAAKAGIKKGDRVLSIQGEAVKGSAAIKIALLNSKPGDKISVVVRRQRFFFGEEELPFDLELTK